MCRKIRLGIFSWVLLFCILYVSLTAASANQEMQEVKITSSLIREELQNLKQNSEILTSQLNSVMNDLAVTSASLTRTSEDLKKSEQKVQQLQTQSIELSTSLTTMNQLLNESYETITKYETELKHMKKVLAILISIFTVMILLKILGYILYAKNIPVPRWIDILI